MAEAGADGCCRGRGESGKARHKCGGRGVWIKSYAGQPSARQGQTGSLLLIPPSLLPPHLIKSMKPFGNINFEGFLKTLAVKIIISLLGICLLILSC